VSAIHLVSNCNFDEAEAQFASAVPYAAEDTESRVHALQCQTARRWLVL